MCRGGRSSQSPRKSCILSGIVNRTNHYESSKDKRLWYILVYLENLNFSVLFVLDKIMDIKKIKLSLCCNVIQVVRELLNYSNEFRVLALSATPGSDIKVWMLICKYFWMSVMIVSNYGKIKLYTGVINKKKHVRSCFELIAYIEWYTCSLLIYTKLISYL